MKTSNNYKHLTSGGRRTVDLTQDEECVVLKAYDFGIAALNEDEIQSIDQVIAKLKDQIWP